MPCHGQMQRKQLSSMRRFRDGFAGRTVILDEVLFQLLGPVGDVNISCVCVQPAYPRLKRGWCNSVLCRFRYYIGLGMKCDVVRKVTLQPPMTRNSGGPFVGSVTVSDEPPESPRDEQLFRA